jgi:hypothetical protein
MDENWLLGHARVQRNSAMFRTHMDTISTDKAINTCRNTYCLDDLHGMYASEHREFLCVE